MPTSPTPPSSNDPRFEMSAVAASDDDYDGGGGTEDEDRSLADSSVYEDDGGGAVILLDATMCRFVFSPAKGSKETRRVCGNQKDLCTRAVPYKHKGASEAVRALTGLYYALPPTRSDSTIKDGDYDKELDAATQAKSNVDRQETHKAQLDALQVSSPGTARGFLSPAVPGTTVSGRMKTETGTAQDYDRKLAPDVSALPRKPDSLPEWERGRKMSPKEVFFPGKYPPSVTFSSEPQYSTAPRSKSAYTTPGVPGLDPTVSTTDLNAAMVAQMVMMKDVTEAMQAFTLAQASAMQAAAAQAAVAPTVSPEPVTAKIKHRSDRRARRSKKYYAVSVGRNTGVYDSSSEARRLVDGYSGGQYRSFRSRREADDWLVQCRAVRKSGVHSGSSDDSSSGRSTTSSSGAEYFSGSRGSPSARSPRAGTDLTYAGKGTDESVGVKDTAFGIQVKHDPNLVKALCPQGLSKEMRDELTEAVLDATALPGMYQHVSDSMIDPGEMAAMIQQGLQVGATANGRVYRDVRWKSQAKIALRTLKCVDDIDTLQERLADIETNATDNMYRDMRSVLARLHLPEEWFSRYLWVGLLPFLGRRSLELYIELVMFLRGKAHGSIGWTGAKVAIDYYTKNLEIIRTGSTIRIAHLCETYIFLRESRAQNWNPSKLRDKYHDSLETRFADYKISIASVATGLPAAGGAATGGGRSPNCLKCCTKVHGQRPCPFVELSNQKAKKAGSWVLAALVGDANADLHTLYTEAIAATATP